jgi:hypothetical protein
MHCNYFLRNLILSTFTITSCIVTLSLLKTRASVLLGNCYTGRSDDSFSWWLQRQQQTGRGPSTKAKELFRLVFFWIFAGIVQSVQRQAGIWFPAGARDFSLLHSVQTGYAAHPASYPSVTGGSFLGVKADEAWSWPPSISKVKKGSAAPPLPHTSWCVK